MVINRLRYSCGCDARRNAFSLVNRGKMLVSTQSAYAVPQITCTAYAFLHPKSIH